MKLTDLTLTTPYLDLDPIFYDKVSPTPLHRPKFISLNPSGAELLGLKPDLLTPDEVNGLLNGTLILEGSIPYAMCYAGHQFGHYVPRLGDGRAINLGKSNGWNLQLKGSGQTLYSRQGDGRAVLRSSIREYLIAEAMHALGIPTTRSFALIGSEERVARERWEEGAIVLRLSPSWIRFGSFEYFYHTHRHRELKSLADFLLAESYPHLQNSPESYVEMFREIVSRTAELIALWQSVGFNHGVMNTDNMSAAGLTIDYGPYAFMDTFESGYICNHTDTYGRYSYDSQPGIGLWNLQRLALALSPLIPQEKLESALELYAPIYSSKLQELLRAKLGLDDEHHGDGELYRELFKMLEDGYVDMTPFFRMLSRYDGERSSLLAQSLSTETMNRWLDRYDARLELNTSSTPKRHTRMLCTNPKYVLKNYILQESIELAEQGDYTLVNNLLHIAQNPYDEHERFERYARATPSEHKNIRLSCSS